MKTKKSNRLLALLLVLCMVGSMLPFTASALEVDVGTGTEQNPIPVRTAQELADIAGMINSGSLYGVLDMPAGETVYYRLEADISLADYAGGPGWTPIGTEASPFEGYFDGNGHTISGMRITKLPQGESYAGLFGVIGADGSVSSLRLTDSLIEIPTIAVVGLLAGKSAGTIENCEVGGTVNTSTSGGLAGEIDGGTVKNCLVTARVTGGNVAGGLYAKGAPDTLETCAVLSPEVKGRAYALGPGAADKAEDCITWDKMGGSPDFGGAGTKSVEELQNEQTWRILGGGAFQKSPWTYEAGLLPSLSGAAQPLPGYMIGGLSGSGTQSDPYTITSLDDLRLFARQIQSDGAPGVYFKLVTDLDMTGYDYEDKEKGWKPLTPFQGIFDGGGKAIQNLYINRPEEDNIGFFSGIRGDADYFGEDRNPTYGVVHDLGIVNCDITGNESCGAVAGELYGAKIERCYSTGTVLGGQRFDNPEEKDYNKDPMAKTGGLVGTGYFGIIRACYSTADVKGLFAVGGIAGRFHGTLTDCYTTGNVTGVFGNGIGGILGMDQSNGTVLKRCYSMSKVSSGKLLFRPVYFGSACGTGGIAGWTVGAASDLVALNPGVDSESNIPAYVNKCVGYQTDYYGDNIRLGGWVDTQVNGNKMGPTSLWDSYAQAYLQPDTWVHFAASGAWILVDGKLPVLNGIDGQDGTPPTWFQDGYAELYNDPPEKDDTGKVYYIDTPANLAWCSLNAGELSGKILDFRAKELDLSAYTMNGGWIPIGSRDSKTTGLQVKGNGCVITNMMIRTNNMTSEYGLFGCLKNSMIRDLHLRGVDIDVEDVGDVGMLVGWVEGGTITNCSVEGNIRYTGSGKVGGIIGIINNYDDETVIGTAELEKLSASGNIEVKGTRSNQIDVGGIVGYISTRTNPAKIGYRMSDLYANVDITGNTVSSAGGIAGMVRSFYDATIKNCYSRGSIRIEDSEINSGYAGGLIGYMDLGLPKKGGQKFEINNCYSTGSLEGNHTGGVLGLLAVYMPYTKPSALESPAQLTFFNVAALAESVTGRYKAGPFMGDFFGYHDYDLQNFNLLSAGRVFVWDGTVYREGGSVTDSPTGGQNAQYGPVGYESLTTEQVLGRKMDGDVNRYLFFSDMTWATGWNAFDGLSNMNRGLAVGRLPTLIMDGHADRHIVQVGDVPLYISMKHPDYIKEFNLNSSEEGVAPIGIYSRADLDRLRTFYELVGGSLNVHLTRDLDLGDQDYVPIGHTGGKAYSGVFDGHGYVIKNLRTQSSKEGEPVGLFARTTHATIQNLGLVDPQISGSGPAGGLAGFMDSSSAILNCFVTSSRLQPGVYYPDYISTSETAGGLAGAVDATGRLTIRNCYTAVNVLGTEGAGGLVGAVTNSNGNENARVAMESVFVAGQTISAVGGSGGLVGSLETGDTAIKGAVILSPSIESPQNPEWSGYAVGINQKSRPGTIEISVLEQTRSAGVTRADYTGTQVYAGQPSTLEALHLPDNWNGFADQDYWKRANGKTPVLTGFYTYRQGNYLPELPVKIDALTPNAEGWYEIHDAQDWMTMCNMVNILITPYATGKYKLMADIDLGKDTQLFTLYQPVGQGAPFLGEFDGNGKTVAFGQPLAGGGGLFGRIGKGGSIHDLTIEADIQSSTAEYLGGAAGLAEAGSTLKNITVTGSIRGTDVYRVGGIVGDSSGTVENCVSEAAVTVSRGNADYLQAGGIAGRQRSGVITACRNGGRVEVQGSGAAGGLIGNATLPQTLEAPSLQDSLNTGFVSAVTSGGGLIGEMTGGFVRGCASTGELYASRGGGLIGQMTCPAGYASSVTDCYATGAVNGGNFMGGLIGLLQAKDANRPNSIARCYATGRVTIDNNDAGGAVGYLGTPRDKANLLFSDVAALNPEVSVRGNARGIGAFVGYTGGNQFTLTNCFTFDEMVLPRNTTRPDGVESIDKETFADISKNAAFWNGSVRFGGDSSLWNSIGGEGTEVRLPTLLNLKNFLDGELPLHLRTFARPQNTTLALSADKTELWSPKGQDTTIVFTAKITGTTQTSVVWSCSDTSLTATADVDKNGNPICTLTIPQEYQDAYSGGKITVTAALKENRAIVSDPVTVTVKARQNAQAPEIQTQPKDTPTVVGQTAALTVAAASRDNGTLSYQWYRTDIADMEGTAIDDATAAIYEAPGAQTGIDYYYCVVTNTIPDGEGIGNTTASITSRVVKVEVTKDAQKALTIVGGNQIRTYGDADFTLKTANGSGTGAVTWQSSAPGIVSIAADTGKATIHKAGEVKITATKAEDHQYHASSAEITVTVNKAKLTVTADDKAREYGQPNPPLTLTYSGFVKGEDKTALIQEPVVSCSAAVNAAVGTHPITASGGKAENYTFDYVAGTLTVTKTGQTPLSILQGVQIDKSYGDAPLTLTVTGGAGSGAVRWASSDNTVATVDQTGKVTLHQAGSAVITATKAADGAFVEAKASAIITVEKAVLTVTAKNAEKHFGEENPELSYTINGFVNGEDQTVLTKQPAISVDTAIPAAELPVGSYVIKIGGGDAANYSFVYHNATLIVNKANQSTFQIEGGNPTKTYGDAPFTMTAKNSAGGAVIWQSGDESVATVNETTGEVAITGAGKVQITAISAETGNFAEAVAAVTLTVDKAKLQMKADPQTRVYGDCNPDFTYTIDGFVNGEDETNLDELPKLTVDANEKTGVGKYAIRLMGGVDGNYDYVLNNAELTITPRPITIAAEDKEMAEGDALPELTWTVIEGSLVNGDTLEGALKAGGTSAGTHPISEDTPFANPNYTVTFLPGTLTVVEKPNASTPTTGDSFPAWPFWMALLSLCGIGLMKKSKKLDKQA